MSGRAELLKLRRVADPENGLYCTDKGGKEDCKKAPLADGYTGRGQFDQMRGPELDPKYRVYLDNGKAQRAGGGDLAGRVKYFDGVLAALDAHFGHNHSETLIPVKVKSDGTLELNLAVQSVRTDKGKGLTLAYYQRLYEQHKADGTLVEVALSGDGLSVRRLRKGEKADGFLGKHNEKTLHSYGDQKKVVQGLRDEIFPLLFSPSDVDRELTSRIAAKDRIQVKYDTEQPTRKDDLKGLEQLFDSYLREYCAATGLHEYELRNFVEIGLFNEDPKLISTMGVAGFDGKAHPFDASDPAKMANLVEFFKLHQKVAEGRAGFEEVYTEMLALARKAAGPGASEVKVYEKYTQLFHLTYGATESQKIKLISDETTPSSPFWRSRNIAKIEKVLGKEIFDLRDKKKFSDEAIYQLLSDVHTLVLAGFGSELVAGSILTPLAVKDESTAKAQLAFRQAGVKSLDGLKASLLTRLGLDCETRLNNLMGFAFKGRVMQPNGSKQEFRTPAGNQWELAATNIVSCLTEHKNFDKADPRHQQPGLLQRTLASMKLVRAVEEGVPQEVIPALLLEMGTLMGVSNKLAEGQKMGGSLVIPTDSRQRSILCRNPNQLAQLRWTAQTESASFCEVRAEVNGNDIVPAKAIVFAQNGAVAKSSEPVLAEVGAIFLNQTGRSPTARLLITANTLPKANAVKKWFASHSDKTIPADRIDVKTMKGNVGVQFAIIPNAGSDAKVVATGAPLKKPQAQGRQAVATAGGASLARTVRSSAGLGTAPVRSAPVKPVAVDSSAPPPPPADLGTAPVRPVPVDRSAPPPPPPADLGAAPVRPVPVDLGAPPPPPSPL